MKRINFTLSKDQDQNLRKISIQKGETKSAVLRKWIENFQLHTSKDKNLTSYNFSIPTDTYQKLEKICTQNDLKRSELLRSVISSQIEENKYKLIYSKINYYNLQNLYQNAVDTITKELNLLGAVVGIIDKDRLYSQALSTKWYSQKLFGLMPKSLNEYYISITHHPDNLITQAILNKKPYVTHDLYDISKYAYNPTLSRVASSLVGFKSGIVLPIMHNQKVLGTLFIMSAEQTDFTDKQKALEKYCNNLAKSIINFLEFKILCGN